jgi:hypothetical protein
MSKDHWNTEEIIGRFDDLECEKVKALFPGGDWNTDRVLIISPSGYRLWISGFVDMNERPLSDRDQSDSYIEFVELTDGKDSSGGLNSDDPEDIQFYAEVRTRLNDYDVVDSWKDRM